MKTEIIEKCPLCGKNNHINFGKIGDVNTHNYSGTVINAKLTSSLYKCIECDSMYISPRVSQKSSSKMYRVAPPSRWSNANIKQHNIDGLFNEYTPTEFQSLFKKKFLSGRSRKVLDVGCFEGKVLDIFKKFGFDTYGIDLNKRAIEVLSMRHKAICGEVFDAYKFNVKFDIIIAFDIIEHLYDVESFISEISKLLNKDGIFIVLTGNPQSLGAKIFRNKWWYFQFPEHIVFPSVGYYKNLVLKHKLEVEEIYHVYHRKAYVRGKVYKMKMYILLMYSIIMKISFKKAFSQFVLKTLSVPDLSSDHILIFLRKL